MHEVYFQQFLLCVYSNDYCNVNAATVDRFDGDVFASSEVGYFERWCRTCLCLVNPVEWVFKTNEA